jgi:hypothetical protein
MGLLALTFVLSFATGTLSSGIIIRVTLTGVCVRGALSMFRYSDLEKEIAAAKAENSRTSAMKATAELNQ